MIHTTEDFFNKLANDIRGKYFANEIHLASTNENYYTTTRVIELFNNGQINYRKLVGRLSKSCKDTTQNIHNIVSKHIVSFGQYEYKPTIKN